MVQLNAKDSNLLLNKLFAIHSFFYYEGTYFESEDRETIVRLAETCIDILNNNGVYAEHLFQKVYDRTRKG